MWTSNNERRTLVAMPTLRSRPGTLLALADPSLATLDPSKTLRRADVVEVIQPMPDGRVRLLVVKGHLAGAVVIIDKSTAKWRHLTMSGSMKKRK